MFEIISIQDLTGACHDQDTIDLLAQITELSDKTVADVVQVDEPLTSAFEEEDEGFVVISYDRPDPETQWYIDLPPNYHSVVHGNHQNSASELVTMGAGQTREEREPEDTADFSEEAVPEPEVDTVEVLNESTDDELLDLNSLQGTDDSRPFEAKTVYGDIPFRLSPVFAAQDWLSSHQPCMMPHFDISQYNYDFALEKSVLRA